MAETKDYFTQSMENGSVRISEDVVTYIAGLSVLDVEGVSGISGLSAEEITGIHGMKVITKGIRLRTSQTGEVSIDCDVMMKFGVQVFEAAKAVQATVKTNVESITGIRVANVNVNICGVGPAIEKKN